MNLPEQTMTTGVARLSYAHLFKPYAANQGQEPKYSTTILIPKVDVMTKQAIDMAIEAAKRTGVAEKFGGVLPPTVPTPVYDGDGRRPSDGLSFGDECKGHWVFTASSKNPVAVVDMSRQPVVNETEIYSGAYAYVSVTFFPYNSNGRKGVGCGLNCVMKAKDGESLGGGISVDKAFANIPMPPTPAPVYPAQQPAYAGHTAQPVYAVQQAAAPASQIVQINPITGQPMTAIPGGVMGL